MNSKTTSLQPPQSVGAAIRLLFEYYRKEPALAAVGFVGIILGLILLVIKFVHGPIIEPEGVLQKAISFDLALGIYLLTIMLFLPLADFSERGLRRWRLWQIIVIMLAYAIENIQIGRGLDPRFSNHGTPTDQMIGGIFFLVAQGVLVLFIILAASIFRRQKNSDKPILLLASRYAFASAILGFAGGEWISFVGGPQFGASGNIMPLHGLSFHGLQAVPLLAILLNWSDTPPGKALKWIHLAGSMWLAACLGIGLQTMMGQSIFAINPLTFLTAGFFVVWASVAFLVVNLWRSSSRNPAIL